MLVTSSDYVWPYCQCFPFGHVTNHGINRTILLSGIDSAVWTRCKVIVWLSYGDRLRVLYELVNTHRMDAVVTAWLSKRSKKNFNCFH